jgi:hypothetical protein
VDTDIQNYARANMVRSGNATRITCFTARFDPASSMRFLNYAAPDEQAALAIDDIAELVDAFRSRDLLPRLEYLPRCSPRLEAALTAAGFTVESRMPLMTCRTGEAVNPRPVEGTPRRGRWTSTSRTSTSRWSGCSTRPSTSLVPLASRKPSHTWCQPWSEAAPSP